MGSTVTRGVRRSDVVLTAVLLAVCLIQVLWVAPIAAPLVGVVVALGSVLPLAWRRARPVAAAVVGTGTWLIPTTEGFLALGYVVAILLLYALGRWSTGRISGTLACSFALLTGTVGTLQGPEEPIPGLLVAWMVVLAPYTLGRHVAAEARDAAARFETDREGVRRSAAEEERTRIVRELHDVVGHEVTLLSLQSEAAAEALRHDPDRAREPVEAVRETAHRANRELRAILDLIGHDDMPVAADGRGLAELADRAARAGIPNVLEISGEPWPDAPRHWLAVNRIVQECLTNAGKHAPGSEVCIAVAWAEEGIEVRAENLVDGPSARHLGRGVPGMVERARTLGGTLTTECDRDRYVVHAWLPATNKEWP